MSLQRTTPAAKAAQAYLAYKQGKAKPHGAWHNGAWYPEADETCACCAGIVDPQYGNPLALLSHCKGKRHIAARYGVTETQLTAALKG